MSESLVIQVRVRAAGVVPSRQRTMTHVTVEREPLAAGYYVDALRYEGEEYPYACRVHANYFKVEDSLRYFDFAVLGDASATTGQVVDLVVRPSKGARNG
jgi:hypothetical protein